MLNQLVQDKEIKEEYGNTNRNGTECESRIRVVSDESRQTDMVYSREKDEGVMRVMG